MHEMITGMLANGLTTCIGSLHVADVAIASVTTPKFSGQLQATTIIIVHRMFQTLSHELIQSKGRVAWGHGRSTVCRVWHFTVLVARRTNSLYDATCGCVRKTLGGTILRQYHDINLVSGLLANHPCRIGQPSARPAGGFGVPSERVQMLVCSLILMRPAHSNHILSTGGAEGLRASC